MRRSRSRRRPERCGRHGHGRQEGFDVVDVGQGAVLLVACAGRWGSTEWADEYFWLIDAERPGDYPVLGRSDDGGAWDRCDRSTSEFSTASLPMPIFNPSGSRSTPSARRSRPAPATPSTASRSDERLAVPRSWTRQCRRFSSRSVSQASTNCLRNRSPNAVRRDQRSHDAGRGRRLRSGTRPLRRRHRPGGRRMEPVT